MKRKAFPAFTVSILLLLFALSLPANAGETENVFVVIIDGIRDTEAFDDPSHQYIPYLWNVLRPQGTIYTEFFNDYLTTYTTPAHSALLTGQWHFQPNLLHPTAGAQPELDLRPEAPTIFEYYRKHFSTPAASCLFVTGKYNNIQNDWSLEPAYGPDYAANIYVGGTDNQTFDLFAAKLAEHQPAVVMVNFQDVDKIAHTGDWNGYLNAIVDVDLLIYRIWTELIQANPHYANKTTMIVTSDHGRNDDVIGFTHHGGMSPANRHLPFLAIGPDTPADLVVTEKRFQIDVAATVGEMLGFPTPFSHGQVMTEMIEPALDPDPRIRVYQKNARAASYNDSVFVTWSENDPADMGNERVYFMHKHAADPGFSTPFLINDAAAARWGFFPAVAANKNGVHVAWLDSRPLYTDDDSWTIFYRKSPDWGETWDPEKIIATSTFGSPSGDFQIVGEPELIATSVGELVITVRYRSPFEDTQITTFRSGNGGVTWGEKKVRSNNLFPRQYMATGYSKGYEAGLVWIDMVQKSGMWNHYSWDVFFMRTMDGGTSWKNYQRLSYDTGHTMMPQIAWNGSRLVTAWTMRESSGTPWKMQVRTSSNKGRSWTWTQDVAVGSSAWQPAVVWNPAAGKFTLVWTDYGTALPDIAVSTSSNGTSWVASDPVADNPEARLRSKPCAAYADGQVYVFWEELDPGTNDWLIQSASID
jgi:hypothetical protein